MLITGVLRSTGTGFPSHENKMPTNHSLIMANIFIIFFQNSTRSRANHHSKRDDSTWSFSDVYLEEFTNIRRH